MIIIAFHAQDVQKVVASCRDRGFDRIWLLRTSTSISLSTPDLAESTKPKFLGSGCADVFGDSSQANVDAVSVFHKTLKTLYKMSEKDAKNVWMEIQFRDREFRLCLTRSEDGKPFTPGGV